VLRYLDFAVTRPQQTFPGIGMWIVWTGRAVSGVVIPPLTPAVTPPSGGYWPETRRRTPEDIRRDRIEFGVLPPDLKAQADQAVAQAVQAEQIPVTNPEAALRAQILKMEALAAFEAAYKQAFKDAYIEAAVADLWREQIRLVKYRRAIALLLLQ
jgi:hypothetical protein